MDLGFGPHRTAPPPALGVEDRDACVLCLCSAWSVVRYLFGKVRAAHGRMSMRDGLSRASSCGQCYDVLSVNATTRLKKDCIVLCR